MAASGLVAKKTPPSATVALGTSPNAEVLLVSAGSTPGTGPIADLGSTPPAADVGMDPVPFAEVKLG